MSAPPVEATKVCMGCGRAIPVSYVACPYCGAQSQVHAAPAPQPQVVYAQPAPQPQVVVAPMQPMPAATRTCLGCGLQIPMNYNVCPHCGKPVGTPGGGEQMGGIRYLLYIISFLFSLIGIIIGIVLMMSHEPDKKRVGKNCLILGVLSIVIEILCWVFVVAAIMGGLLL